jgi:hypothetical protein
VSLLWLCCRELRVAGVGAACESAELRGHTPGRRRGHLVQRERARGALLHHVRGGWRSVGGERLGRRHRLPRRCHPLQRLTYRRLRVQGPRVQPQCLFLFSPHPHSPAAPHTLRPSAHTHSSQRTATATHGRFARGVDVCLLLCTARGRSHLASCARPHTVSDASGARTVAQVGRKTTLRVQNRQYCGFAEQGEWCVYYTKVRCDVWSPLPGPTAWVTPTVTSQIRDSNFPLRLALRLDVGGQES